MSRLIDSDALEREGWSLHRTFQKDEDTMVYEVKKPSDFPIIEERKTGKWVDKGGYIECSNCGCLAPSVEFADKVLWKKSSFCPDCGARMVQEGGDNDS